MLKRVLRLFAEYFVFVVGLLFIFLLGIVYALLRLEGWVANIFFFLIALGWVVFLIKYFWELLEKRKKPQLADSNSDYLLNSSSKDKLGK